MPFKDSIGNEWSIDRITVASIDKVRKETGLDLCDPQQGNTIDKLRHDPVALINVVFVLAHPDPLSISLSREKFAARFWGDSITEARKALEVGLQDFFPSGKRALWVRLIEWVAEQESEMVAKTEKPIAELLDELPPNSESTPEHLQHAS